MINGIVNTISTPGFQNLIQNTTAQVSIETGLKAVGRPLFTLADKHVDEETRKYSAVKELLYQILCLGIYLAIIPPIFKKGGFKIFKKICQKANKMPEFLKEISTKTGKEAIEKCSIDAFKNEKALLSVYKLGQMTPAERKLAENKDDVAKLCKTIKDNLVESVDYEKFINEAMEAEKDSKFFKQFYMAKGGMEISSIVGSVIGLTLLAPELSHLILHPILHAVGLEAPKKTADIKSSEQKIDIQV